MTSNKKKLYAPNVADIWSELYPELKFEEGFGETIYEILLKEMIELSQSNYEKMKI